LFIPHHAIHVLNNNPSILIVSKYRIRDKRLLLRRYWPIVSNRIAFGVPLLIAFPSLDWSIL